MRAARLDTPTDILVLTPALAVEVLDWVWTSITAKDAADVPPQAGLRSPARVDVRAWYDDRLLQGRYLRAEGRLLHIDSVRDPSGRQTEMVITASELIGEPATYTPLAGAPAPCRVHLAHGVTRPGELTGRTEYTTQLEAALIEVGRPQPGGVFHMADQTWRVAGLVEDDDDRVTRRMWVKPV